MHAPFTDNPIPAESSYRPPRGYAIEMMPSRITDVVEWAMDPSAVRRLWRARDFIYTEFRSSPSLSSVVAEVNYSPFHFHRLY